MNILFATTGLPHLQTTGGEIASQAFVDAMRAAGHAVEVFGYARGPGPVPLGSMAVQTRAIESRGAGLNQYVWLLQALVRRRPYGCQKFVSRQYLSRLRQLTRDRKADVLVLDHARMGWLLPHARSLARSAVLIAHNHEAKLCADQAEIAAGSMHRQVFARESRLFDSLEIALARHVDQIWTLSAAERTAFQNIVSSTDKVILMDVPGTAQDPVQTAPTFDIGLLGTWDWSVNGRGLDWFVEHVVPELPQNLTICVAGRGSERLNGRRRNMTGLGYVDDPSAFLAQARVLAIPTTVGAGIQLKTINAISAGVPTVSTTMGVRGIDDLPAYVQVADTPKAFAQALLKQLSAARPAAETGRKWAHNRRVKFNAQVGNQLARLDAPVADGWISAGEFAR